MASLAEAAASTAAPVIVNCAGTGARDLVPDPAVIPYRGQVVMAENPGLTEFFIGQKDADHELVYVFPHDEPVVLGGTEGRATGGRARPGHGRPDPARCAAVDTRLATARIIEHRVGFRPARPQVRLEAEDAVAADGSSARLLVHNYGHGGAGVSLSWGCARAWPAWSPRWPSGAPGRRQKPGNTARSRSSSVPSAVYAGVCSGSSRPYSSRSSASAGSSSTPPPALPLTQSESVTGSPTSSR